MPIVVPKVAVKVLHQSMNYLAILCIAISPITKKLFALFTALLTYFICDYCYMESIRSQRNCNIAVVLRWLIVMNCSRGTLLSSDNSKTRSIALALLIAASFRLLAS